MAKNYTNEKFEVCHKDICVRSEGKTVTVLNWILVAGLIGLTTAGVVKALKG